MHRQMFWLSLMFVLATVACSMLSLDAIFSATPTPDRIAIGVAEAKAIATTLTAEIPTALATLDPSVTATTKLTTITKPAPTAIVKPIPTIPAFPNSERIYFSVGDNLYQMNLDGSGLRALPKKWVSSNV